jgi:hypothetical protein
MNPLPQTSLEIITVFQIALINLSTRALGGCILVKLGTHEVGETVIPPAVGVDGPEHGPDQTGVSLGFTQSILGSGRSLAGD